jgi:hypothetical protein
MEYVMSKPDAATGAPVYRIDKFVVPHDVRDEFLGRVRQTHEILRRQEGFVRDLILERAAESGALHIITMAEWKSLDVVPRVRAAVMAFHKEIGFNPADMYARLLDVDLGMYGAVTDWPTGNEQ